MLKPEHPERDHQPEDDSDVRALLDFVLRYEEDRAHDVLRTLPEYQRLFPHAAELIADEFHLLQAGTGASGEPRQAQNHEKLDHYVLERQLGRGGQGHVYLAVDTRVRRHVALKVLSRAHLSADALRRFQREVEVIAKLDHPGLCAVYEANLGGPRPYLAMRYVQGEDLARQIANRKSQAAPANLVGPRTTLELARLLQFFERAARALHAAHEAGVIHRDIKPANILMRNTGEPVIVDFGLARDEDPQAESLTLTDDVLGTPAYMAPELLGSGASSIDRRTDVYALGVTLYECLTLERPFVGSTRESVFEHIRHGVYTNPRERNDLVSEELRVVLAMAMDLDPSRRYSSALDFAEDLRRIREYEPIVARSATWPIRLRRWSQRHPQLAASFALVAIVTALWLVTLTATVRQVKAESARLRAANEHLLAVEFREDSRAALESNAGLALSLAIEADKLDPGFESNMALLRALASSYEQRTLFPAFDDTYGMRDALAFRGGVVALTAGGLSFFDLSGSLPYRTAETPMLHPSGLVSAADESRLAAVDVSRVCVFDGSTGKLNYALDHEGTTAESCHFSPDSRWLLTATRNGIARILDARDGAILRTLTPGTGTITLARFDPSGRFVITATDGRRDIGSAPPTDYDPRLWDAASGTLVARLSGHSNGVRKVTFTADGQYVLTICADGLVRCWRTSDQHLMWASTLPGEGWSLGISPDGRRVAAGFDSGVRLFDRVSGEVLFDLAGFDDRSSMNVAFSPDSRRIAATDYGGGVGAWDASDGRSLMAARFESSGPGTLSWLPDSIGFVTSAASGGAHVWTTRRIPLLTGWHAHTQRVRTCVFSPSSAQVLSAGDDGRINLHDASEGLALSSWTLAEPVERAWFADQGQQIIGLTRAGRIFRVRDELELMHAGSSEGVHSSAIARDGSSVLVGFGNGHVEWIDALDGRLLFATETDGAKITAVAISGDGTRAAWCSEEGLGGALDRTTGRRFPFRLEAADQHVHVLAFTIDGARIVANGNSAVNTLIGFDESAKWSTDAGRPLSALVPLRDPLMLVTFKWLPGLDLRDHSNGKTIWERGRFGSRGRYVSLYVNRAQTLAVAASTAGDASLWQIEGGKPLVRYEHGQSPLTCAELSPDDRAVVTAAEDGSIRVWPVELRTVAQAHVPAPPEAWRSRFPTLREDE